MPPVIFRSVIRPVFVFRFEVDLLRIGSPFYGH